MPDRPTTDPAKPPSPGPGAAVAAVSPPVPNSVQRHRSDNDRGNQHERRPPGDRPGRGRTVVDRRPRSARVRRVGHHPPQHPGNVDDTVAGPASGEHQRRQVAGGQHDHRTHDDHDHPGQQEAVPRRVPARMVPAPRARAEIRSPTAAGRPPRSRRGNPQWVHWLRHPRRRRTSPVCAGPPPKAPQPNHRSRIDRPVNVNPGPARPPPTPATDAPLRARSRRGRRAGESRGYLAAVPAADVLRQWGTTRRVGAAAPPRTPHTVERGLGPPRREQAAATTRSPLRQLVETVRASVPVGGSVHEALQRVVGMPRGQNPIGHPTSLTPASSRTLWSRWD